MDRKRAITITISNSLHDKLLDVAADKNISVSKEISRCVESVYSGHVFTDIEKDLLESAVKSIASFNGSVFTEVLEKYRKKFFKDDYEEGEDVLPALDVLRPARNDTITGYKGVYVNGKKYTAKMRIYGKDVIICSEADPRLCALKRDEYIRKQLDIYGGLETGDISKLKNIGKLNFPTAEENAKYTRLVFERAITDSRVDPTDDAAAELEKEYQNVKQSMRKMKEDEEKKTRK